MSSPADVPCDPIGTVVAAVTVADPTLERDMVRQIVEQVGGGRAKRRRLAMTLAEDASVLTSGRSPAPRVVGDLLIALRAAGAVRISAPRCAGCGHELATLQRRGEDWYCSPCSAPLLSCAGCGHQRKVTFRDRHGQPRCWQCPDHNVGDPHLVLVEAITTLDPGLTATAVRAALETTVVRPAHLHKLAWAIDEDPELLTGQGARAPFPMVLRLIDALCDAGATHIRRPACPRCERVVTLSKRLDGLRVCRNCYARARAVVCVRCQAVREPAGRDTQGQPLCPNCLAGDPINLEDCVGCGRRRQVNTRTEHGPMCAACVPRLIATCSVCGRVGPCKVSRTTGLPWCGACSRSQAHCSGCGVWAAVRAGTRQAPLCAGCAVTDPAMWKTCPTCGVGGRLTARICGRCQLHVRLGELLADSDGQIRPELQALHDSLAAAERAETVVAWLRRDTVVTVLAELATGQQPLSHDTLDRLPPGKPIEHLRSMLVATGALPVRDEQLARIERWVTRTVNEHSDPQGRELLHRYAIWHLLRRLRHRNRGIDTTYSQLDVVRQRVRAAIGLLDWLHARGLTLATCGQGELDAWLTGSDITGRAQAGHFVRWAVSQNINRDLQFAATRWTGPVGPLDHEHRWEQARRLLHDDTLATDDRVAGLLVLLYAQRAATISRLTLDDIDTSQGTVTLRLGSVPVVLPEPVATLTRELITTRRGHAVLGAPGTSRWLFPGGQPGRPVSADRLGQRLRVLGIRPAHARSAALFQLATELPAAILARMLGIHIQVAVAWQHASAGDWTGYAADVARRTDNPQVP